MLHSIAEFLKVNINDLRHCREVSKNWWNSTTMSALLPQLMETSPPEVMFSSSVFVLRAQISGSTPWFVGAAEITKGNIQLLHPFLGTPLNVPDNLNLAQFQPCLLATAYHLADVNNNHDDFFTVLNSYTKVLLFSKQSDPSFDDCAQLVLDNRGQLGGFPPFHSWYKYKEEEEGGKEYVPWLDISLHSANRFDDIVIFEGSIHVLDRQGKLYQMSRIIFGGLREMADGLVCKAEGPNMGWRKRLVASSSGEKLYLVIRENAMIKVYKLSLESEKSGRWVEVQSFGDDHQMLFVSRLYCFFVSAREFPGCTLSDCIIFSLDAFPPYSNSGWKCYQPSESEEHIQIFRLGHDSGSFRPISSYPGFPINLWSPPPWILQAGTPSQSHSHRETAEDEEMQFVMNNHQEDASLSSMPSLVAQIGTPSDSAAEGVITRAPMIDVKLANGKESNQEIARDEISTHYVPSATMTQNKKNDYSTVKFEGLIVRSSLLPTLQNLWSEHGNIVENCTFQNSDIVARALESLATVVLILEQNSARSLSDSAACYMSSALSDLRCMHFKVDWLIPCVEKALNLHKCKLLLESLNKRKAQALEQRLKLLESVADLDNKVKELEEEMTNMAKMIPFSGDVDLDRPLRE